MAEDLHRIELRSSNLDDLRSYLDGAAVTFGCRPVARQEGVEYVVNVYAPVGDIERLRFARNVPGVTMNVLENTSDGQSLRQSDSSDRARHKGVAP
jgi:hypothetical protein